MKIHEFSIIFLFIFFHQFENYIQFELTNVIQTDKGPVQGEIRMTVRKSMKFSSFRGIPYAKAPLGYLRFKPPVEADAWTKIFNATSDGNPCPQRQMKFNNYIGDEDCLNLNVYAPKVHFPIESSSTVDLLPVMVWIFGGSYKQGDAKMSMYGPDYLIENDVIVVVMNYRLGALGFLAVNHPNATGNAGLKDQLLALKWVQRNIKSFGGDPNSVTIFGESVGGFAVDFLMLSDASQGLFHRSISMSASSLCLTSFYTPSQAISRAFELGELLEIDTDNDEELLTTLYDVTARDLVDATAKITTNERPFKPIIENTNITDTAVITESFVKNYKSGNFHRLPHITGFLASEVITFLPSLPSLKIAAENINETKSLKDATAKVDDDITVAVDDYPPELTVSLLNITNVQPKTVLIENAIETIIQNLTDLLWIIGIDSKQRLMQNYAPVYYYRISIEPEASYHRLLRNIDIAGAAHGDDIAYLWYISDVDFPTDRDDPFVITRDRVTRMWTNFAKYSNPTPNGTNDTLLNITWPISGSDGYHLEINRDLSIGGRPIDASVESLRDDYMNYLSNL